MADMRKALEQAGLVSQKKLRQAKHRDRVRRKELGDDGVEAQRAARDAEQARAREEQKRADAARQQAQRTAAEADARHHRLLGLFQRNDLSLQEAGPRRYFFELPDGRIRFVDVSDAMKRRLAQGDAVIADGAGLLDREFVLLPGKAVSELEATAPERILFWAARTGS